VPTIQTYGDNFYINYAQTIRAYTNSQYQGYAQSIQTAANTAYQSDVQTIQSYAQNQYQTSVQTIQTYANQLYQNDVATIQSYGQTRYATLTQQVQNSVAGAGTIQNNAFVLNGSSITGYAPLLLSSNDLTTFQALTANGTIGTQALQPVQVATPGNLTLVANTADIGSQAAPFGYQIVGNLVTASAGNNVYLNALSGDAMIGQVFAGGLASIAAPYGSILSYLPGVTVKATSIDLVAENNISCATGQCGSSGSAPFQVQVGVTGSLTGSAGGSASFYAPTPSVPPPVNLQLGSFSAPEGLSISAAAGVEILANATLSASGGAISITGGSFTMDAHSAVIAGTSVTVATLTGDAVLGKLQATAATGTTANPDIVVTSGGSIFGNGDGQVNVVGGAASLVAGSSIGTSSLPVTIGTPLLSASALNGSLYLGTGLDLHMTSLSAVNGNVSIIGALGLTLDSVSAGTALGATGTIFAQATNGTLALGTLTSSGSQTYHASGDVTLTSLTTTGSTTDRGDIGVTSDHGAITGGSVLANGAATLTASTTNTGSGLTATHGLISLAAGGLIDWSTLSAGTTLGATSSAGGITFGTAQSGGSETLSAFTNVGFTQLTTIGILGDAGNIGITATTGAITGGSVSANGEATLTAATSNTGNTLTATTGAISLAAGGLIHWNNLTAGTTLGATSSAGGITFGTAQSGGSQTLLAHTDIIFSQLTTTGISGDPGDVNLTATTGAITGGSINAHGSIHGFGNGISFANFTAGNNVSLTSTRDITGHILAAGGDATLTAGAAPGAIGSITLDQITAATFTLNATGSLTLPDIKVSDQLTLHATNMTVGVTQIPLPPLPGTPPLKLDITGPNGGTANSVTMNVNAPAGVVFKNLFAQSVLIDTTALNVAINNGYVPGQMTLLTPAQLILLNDTSPTPTSGNNVQLWQPGYAFGLNLQGIGLLTNSFVVQYQDGSNVTDILDGLPYPGASLVRDVVRDMRNGEGFDFQGIGTGSNSTLYVIGLSPEDYLDAHKLLDPVQAPVSRPAVNLGGH
jgi:hypothetical protein